MEDVREIAFCCPYCHRAHSVGGDARGDVIECLCGTKVEVPETATGPETPADRLPLGKVHRTSDDRSEAAAPPEPGVAEAPAGAELPEAPLSGPEDAATPSAALAGERAGAAEPAAREPEDTGGASPAAEPGEEGAEAPPGETEAALETPSAAEPAAARGTEDLVETPPAAEPAAARGTEDLVETPPAAEPPEDGVEPPTSREAEGAAVFAVPPSRESEGSAAPPPGREPREDAAEPAAAPPREAEDGAEKPWAGASGDAADPAAPASREAEDVAKLSESPPVPEEAAEPAAPPEAAASAGGVSRAVEEGPPPVESAAPSPGETPEPPAGDAEREKARSRGAPPRRLEPGRGRASGEAAARRVPRRRSAPSPLALGRSAREHGVAPEKSAEIEALIWDEAPETLSPEEGGGSRSRRGEGSELDPAAFSGTGTVSVPSSRRSGTRARGSSSMGKGQFIAAIVIFFVWLIHTSPWMYLGAGPAFLQEPLPEAIGIVEHTHYFYLERALWSTLLAGLAIALAGEGYLRWSRGRAGY